jgi:ferric enterobactin receptor
MHKRALSLLTLLMLTPAILIHAIAKTAQEKETSPQIRGIVKDTSGGVLPGTQISIRDTEIIVYADSQGEFSLNEAPPGKSILVASLSGFAKKEIPIETQTNQELKLEIVLEIESREYTVSVEYAAPKLMSASESIGVVSITPRQIYALPSLGEKDVFRSIQLMPGVSGSTESSSGLYVRGGTPDQNLVLFDGFTVYKVDHFFGIFSAFNANAVEDTTIYKGGFESKYGGRISSVVDLSGKSGDKDEISYGGGISLLSVNGYADGPLGKKGSFSFAGRRSYQSPFSTKIRDNYTASAGPGGGPAAQFSSQPVSNFYDVNGRATYTPDNKNTFVLSLYYGKDNFDDERTMNLPSFGTDTSTSYTGETKNLAKWGNTGASLNWHRNWSTIFDSNITLAFSRYFKNSERTSTFTKTSAHTTSSSTTSTDSTDSNIKNPADMDSIESNNLDDITFRWGNSLILGRKHYLEFGAEGTWNELKYYFNLNDDSGIMERFNRGIQQAYYFQDKYQPFKWLEITPGIRASRFSKITATYLEPRFSAIFHATDRFKLKAAGGRYHQFVSNLTREDPMQGDQTFWMLSDNTSVPVSSSNHYIGGASYETAQFLFDVEAYRKELHGLAEFASFRFGIPPGKRPDEINFNNSFFLGTGRAEGIEFLVQKKFGANTGWLTYTLGRVMHNFPGLSSEPYPASHDSTHEIKIVDSYRLKNWTFSGNWVYGSGKPYTEPTGSDEVTMDNGRTMYIPTYGNKNGIRLPDYHRLDLSVSWDFLRRENDQARMGVSVFNAYNHANVWRREYNILEGEIIKTDVNYLGLTVSAFLNFDLNVPSDIRRAGPAWTKVDSKEEENLKPWEKSAKVYDFYARVVSASPDRITVKTNMGTQEFLLTKDSIKGEPEYEDGAYVHLYYCKQAQGNVVTMVVRKVKKESELLSISQYSGKSQD